MLYFIIQFYHRILVLKKHLNLDVLIFLCIIYTDRKQEKSMTAKISKINLKKQRMRTIIFSHICISRQELIRLTGFTGRTVDNYANELKRLGLIWEETTNGLRGRPSIMYRSNSAHIIFVSISIFACKLCFTVIDINSYQLYSNVIILTEQTPSADIIRLSLEELQNIRNIFSNMTIIGIACNRSTYHLDNQRGVKFRELVTILHRLYGIHIEVLDGFTAVFLRLCKSLLLKGNVGVFVLGDNDAYVITDGELRDDLNGYFHNFKHRQIECASQEICHSCRKRGCIESLLSYDSTIRRYQKLTGKIPTDPHSNCIYDSILVQSKAGEPDACRIIRENGIYAARAISIMKKELQLDHILLCNSTPLLHRTLLTEYKRLTGDTAPPLNLIQRFQLQRVAFRNEPASKHRPADRMRWTY